MKMAHTLKCMYLWISITVIICYRYICVRISNTFVNLAFFMCGFVLTFQHNFGVHQKVFIG